MPDVKRDKNSPRQPRPNMQMWIILGLLAVIISVTVFNRAGDPIEISEGRFYDMLNSNDIKRITVVKKEDVALITLTNDALENAKYKSELDKKSQWGLDKNSPHYKVKPNGSVDRFLDRVDKEKPKSSNV